MGRWICSICDQSPCTHPSFHKACRDADRRVAAGPRPSAEVLRAQRLGDPRISLERAYWEIQEAREAERLGVTAFPTPIELPTYEVPNEQWTDLQVFVHCENTFNLAVKGYPDIMESYVVMLVEATDEAEKLAIMRRGLMETINKRYPLREIRSVP